MEKLDSTQIKEALKETDGWELTENSIRKSFKTKGFPQTMGLVTAIGAFCQQHDHHPDFLTMKYSEVEVSFSTHSAGGITKKDIDIAKDINKLNF
ncbi:MAG TPA: 4a-hydroxytetrahydrobiopterin dehydratase [Ignavibacteria bacterium]|nr:4a-hydroxytetrahydrobiopterin dehydratase [Ignavibacteria bacterium]HMR39673.1 4a-hydroxytetrahydrobiopterin dehydratase [Ignavibacteria bacterium]